MEPVSFDIKQQLYARVDIEKETVVDQNVVAVLPANASDN